MQLLKGSALFADDEAGFRRRIHDTGSGPLRSYAYASPRNGACPYHCHARSFELFVAMEGEGVVVVDGEEVRMSKGDALIVEPGEYHLVQAGDEAFHLLCVVAPNLDDAEVKELHAP